MNIYIYVQSQISVLNLLYTPDAGRGKDDFQIYLPSTFSKCVLQCVAVCRSVLQKIAVYCSVLQCVACVAACLPYIFSVCTIARTPLATQVYCGVLQCLTMRCSVFQFTT